jgi:hypothetical protein
MLQCFHLPFYYIIKISSHVSHEIIEQLTSEHKQQNLSSQADSRSAGQKIPRLLWTQRFITVLAEPRNDSRILTPYFLINFNIILPPKTIFT